jgi:hypothetical protein
MKLRAFWFVSLAGCALAGAPVKRSTTYLYTYFDKNGNTVINNLPPTFVQGQGLTLKHVGVGHIRLAISSVQMARVLKSPELLAMVDTIASAEGVDPFLARAVIQAESAFYTKARSRAGALGLMQLMPQTAQRFGVLDPFDPQQNISGGVKYLRWLMDAFKGDLPRVVAAYNCGEGNVIKYNGLPPFPETRAYVPRVMELYNKRLVQADPGAAGSMALLKQGRGGFQVEEKVAAASAKPEPPPQPRASRIYQWVDPTGRTQISDQPPPKGAAGVKVFE